LCIHEKNLGSCYDRLPQIICNLIFIEEKNESKDL
jgi:hypothetical protein